MSRSVDIFVKADAPLEDFVRRAEAILGFDLRRIEEDPEPYYEFRDDRVVLTAGTHDLENDRDMSFEDFPYHLSIRALNLGTEEQRRTRREAFARTVFDKLKATGAYELMLVDDVQTKLEEFSPDRR